MTAHTRTLEMFTAAGGTDPGLQREVNEDRFYVDETRGLFVVIDGVGGQAAGGKAADVALALVRERLERETGPVAERVREAIAIANNEIHRLSSSRPEWDGMACVLTIAVIKDGKATIGHVGDTRLYKLRDGRIDKVTRDHSPVGEREDAREISEFEAMRHPRRNEVYRDVGSERHSPGDPDFVDIHEIPFDASDALLLCSDGLSDLVDSGSMLNAATAWAGNPHDVVRELIAAANAAGGKDNVTVVFVEGENFTATRHVSFLRRAESVAPVSLSSTSTTRRRFGLVAAIVVMVFLSGLMAYRAMVIPLVPDEAPADGSPGLLAQTVVAGASIADALSRAQPGSEVVVEPGEYRERVTLSNGIRLVSRVPRGAIIRLPSSDSDAQAEPAVVATGPASGELIGFKIAGDARTPLGVGILVEGTGVTLTDIEVSGAAMAAISFARDSIATLRGSDLHDNPGAALAIEAGANPRITHNVFSRNGTSQHTPAPFAIERGVAAVFQQNVLLGVRPDVFATLDEVTRLSVQKENWFLPHQSAVPGSLHATP
jgi:serine/threonine protein phosphatase PrpC